MVKGDHQLRTHGPYAVTRHPIYTGVLAMLLGATLLLGIGQWIVLFPVGLILFEVKIRMEERLMLATFPTSTPGTVGRCHSLSRVSSCCADAIQSARSLPCCHLAGRDHVLGKVVAVACRRLTAQVKSAAGCP